MGLRLRKVLIAKELRLHYERRIKSGPLCFRKIVGYGVLGGAVGTGDGNMYCNSPGKSQREAELGSRPWTWWMFYRLNRSHPIFSFKQEETWTLSG